MIIKKINNAVVYPYNREFTPFLRYSNVEFENLKLVSPPSWGLDKKDASYADGGSFLGIDVSSCLDCTYEADVLIVPQYPENKSIDEIVSKLLSSFKERNKKIYYLVSEYNRITDDMKKYICETRNEIPLEMNLQPNIEFIDTPVLIICGVMENLNKLDIQLVLHDYLSNKGYRVSNITSKDCNPFVPFKKYPDFMFDDSIKYEDKVLLFNSYVREIIKKENPHLVVIQIPGGIMPYSKYINNHFGFFANIIFNAVTPDYTCVSLPCSKIDDDYLSLLSDIFHYRFNADIDSFHMSNCYIEEKKGSNLRLNQVIYDIKNAKRRYEMNKKKYLNFQFIVFVTRKI